MVGFWGLCFTALLDEGQEVEVGWISKHEHELSQPLEPFHQASTAASIYLWLMNIGTSRLSGFTAIEGKVDC